MDLNEEPLKPDAEILRSLRRTLPCSTTPPPSLAVVYPNLVKTFLEVTDLEPAGVKERIEFLMVGFARSILLEKGFKISVPSRATSNQLYLPDLERVVLQANSSSRPFAAVSSVSKATITTRILELVHQLCMDGIHITKRDLFYSDVKLFKDQRESDAVLEDVACLIPCTRSSLNVVASTKGAVVGNLVFTDNGDEINCAKMGVGGKTIPPNIDGVRIVDSDALFVLLVEKEAVFMRLAEDRFYNRFPCIIITGKGQPDIATRKFLRKIKLELKLPVLALVDGDPYGLRILSVYGFGSKNMSYDSASLTTPGIVWLGIRPSDLDKYKIPEQCRLPMTEEDIKTGIDLLEENFVRKHPRWVQELELMIETKQKAEIQALSSFGFRYLTNVYLPRKLQELDYL